MKARNAEFEGISILIVDDEPDLLEILSFEFEHRGATVHVASDGNAAFEIIQSRKVDLILSDIRMPGGDGISLIKRIKALQFDKPVMLFITGFTDLTTQAAYDLGAAAVFTKPYDIQSMVAKLLSLIRPLHLRWVPAPTQTPPESELQVELSAIDPCTGSAGAAFRLGQGGFFIAKSVENVRVENRRLNQELSFKIRFKKGAAPAVALLELVGAGRVLWEREQDDESGPAGLGIEIAALNEECRSPVVEFIRRLQIIPYIPLKSDANSP
jgi:CheY-like chemotaxis protein